MLILENSLSRLNFLNAEQAALQALCSTSEQRSVLRSVFSGGSEQASSSTADAIFVHQTFQVTTMALRSQLTGRCSSHGLVSVIAFRSDNVIRCGIAAVISSSIAKAKL